MTAISPLCLGDLKCILGSASTRQVLHEVDGYHKNLPLTAGDIA